MRVAIIHDWLTGMRGGESVLEALIELFPKAELFTLICQPHKISQRILSVKIHTSVLQKVPFIERYYRYCLPIMPWMIESFNLKPFDLILSSSHCVAKGIQKSEKAFHASYIHAPMRYMWDRFDDYFSPQRCHPITRWIAQIVRKPLQSWDQAVSTPQRIDLLIANSEFIAKQIQHYYQRTAQVVYPFVQENTFYHHQRTPQDFYLMVSALVPYKRVDLAIEVFNKFKKTLYIVGSGPEQKRLHKLADSNIHFLGPVDSATLASLYSKCRALIFPGIEDFGITPLESMASGAPVIAFQKGGVLETVTTETGIFFSPQTVDAMLNAIHQLEQQENHSWTKACQNRSKEFSKSRFQKTFIKVLSSAWIESGRSVNLLNQEIQQVL